LVVVVSDSIRQDTYEPYQEFAYLDGQPSQ
jgi:hypothetical protein